jgi:hypothetical protein
VPPTGRRKGTLGTVCAWGSTPGGVTPRASCKVFVVEKTNFSIFLFKNIQTNKHSTDVNTSRLEYQLIVS